MWLSDKMNTEENENMLYLTNSNTNVIHDDFCFIQTDKKDTVTIYDRMKTLFMCDKYMLNKSYCTLCIKEAQQFVVFDMYLHYGRQLSTSPEKRVYACLNLLKIGYYRAIQCKRNHKFLKTFMVKVFNTFSIRKRRDYVEWPFYCLLLWQLLM